ncbi:restriction endonuclease subunit S [Cellvibrio sp. KY-YJ-3]|uniref:restriction endonuclease subunit S n=1 Tax=Cellvibrio sp. KY-YJ-3 TaxID=454662 RepID=UPI001247E5F6|nr:restriction endonuclease subunit S [Cellvibrio sp. KY-YJ-3]QEY11884.1 restriction endonuclease subunit S [Cellvibrio sp. KY-YJ-3]
MISVPLNSIASIVRGITFAKSEGELKPENNYLPVIRAGSIQQELLLDEGRIWVPKSKIKDDQLIRKNDIIMCTSSGSADLVGKCAISNENWNGSFGAFCCGIRADDSKCIPSYLYFFLNSPVFKEWTKSALGANIKNIRASELAEFKIPLPPLSIQKQIAAILEKADQLRKDCQQMEQELNNLAQAVFIEMFGDPVSNPKGWKTLPLSSIVDDFLGGKSLAASEDEATNFKNRVAKISAVTSGEFKSYESKPLPNDYEPPEAHYIKNGDLLFSRANTTELVGATAMVFNTPGNIVLPDKLWRFVWKADVQLSSVFMWKLLSFPSQRVEISKLSSGSGGSMKNISKEKLSTLNVIFPPVRLQKKYEEFYSLLRRQIEEQKNNMVDADKLFDSLIQKAFSGELNLNHKAA